jgi:hypothetical protein
VRTDRIPGVSPWAFRVRYRHDGLNKGCAFIAACAVAVGRWPAETLTK